MTIEETHAAVRRALGLPEPVFLPPSTPPRGHETWLSYFRALPRRWAQDARNARAPAPEPIVLVPARAPADSEVPASARALVNVVRGQDGWCARATYALAELPAHTRVLASGQERAIEAEMVETLVVRLRAPDGMRGYACWTNGKFDSARLGCERLGARALTARVRSVTPAVTVSDADGYGG